VLEALAAILTLNPEPYRLRRHAPVDYSESRKRPPPPPDGPAVPKRPRSARTSEVRASGFKHSVTADSSEQLLDSQQTLPCSASKATAVEGALPASCVREFKHGCRPFGHNHNM
jgi:hypothetical protein